MRITVLVGQRGVLVKLAHEGGKIITHTLNKTSVIDPDNIFIKVTNTMLFHIT